jgi:hypothetical protein
MNTHMPGLFTKETSYFPLFELIFIIFLLRSVPLRSPMSLSIRTHIMATAQHFQLLTKVLFPFLPSVPLPSCESHAVNTTHCFTFVFSWAVRFCFGVGRALKLGPMTLYMVHINSSDYGKPALCPVLHYLYFPACSLSDTDPRVVGELYSAVQCCAPRVPGCSQSLQRRLWIIPKVPYCLCRVLACVLLCGLFVIYRAFF